jgi:hypothetical protein
VIKLLVTAVFSLVGIGHFKTAPTPADEAKAFLASLTSDQRKLAAYPLKSDTIYDWHFVPRSRPGIPISNLTESQKKIADQLIRANLSRAGYEKVEHIRDLEPYLFAAENNNPIRDRSNYSLVFFGEPSNSGKWAWRFEGHHVSLTFAYRDGKMVASTPQFLGSNPGRMESGPKKGMSVLAKEEDAGYALLASLSSAQLSQATVASEAPAEIVTGNSRRAAIAKHLGIPYHDLNPSQKSLFLDLLKTHAEVQLPAEQERRLKLLEKEDMREMVFAWMGSTTRGGRHYYRVQGDHVIIELDNTQNNGNHIHTVWRNTAEDFGEDTLEEHYAESHHGHHHH